jgi:hypothetical protein
MVRKSTDPELAPVAVAIVHKPNRRPLWRRIARIAAIALASIVALAVIGLVFLQTSWGKSFVRGRIEQKLAAKINGSVRVGSIDYSFLFGEIRIGNVQIRDAAGQPAIAVGSIAVELDRTSLIGGSPVIDDLDIRGLDVSVVQTADGRSNLSGLFKKSTGKPIERIRVSRVAVAGAARIIKPDGTVISVDNLSLGGTVDARPAAKEVDAALSQIAAHVAIAPPTAPRRELDVAIGSVAVGRRADAIDVDVRRITAGALGIESLGAAIRLERKQLRGAQSIAMSGVRVDSEQLAALLGRPLLVEDLAVDVSITGPESALVLDGTVRTGAATLDLDGTVDLSAPSRPQYQIALAGAGLRSDLIDRPGKPLPTIATGIRVDLRGAGTNPADLDADLHIAIGPTTIGELAVDGLDVAATAHAGAYRLERLHADVLGVAIDAAATVGADKTVAGTIDVRGNPANAVKRLAAAGIVLPKQALVPSKLDLSITAGGRLDGEVAVTLARTRIPFAGGAIVVAGNARLDNKRLDRATATIDLRAIDLATAAKLAGRKPKLRGTLNGKVAIERTATAKHADYDLAIALAKPAIDVVARGRAGMTSATARVDALRKSDRAVLATVDATVPLGRNAAGKLGLRQTGTWRVDVDVVRRSLADVADLLPPRLRAKLPAGIAAEVHVDLAGSPARPTGTLAVAIDRGAQRVDLRGAIASSARGIAVETTGAVVLDPDQRAFALIDGTVAMPSPFARGKLDIEAARRGATVDATIEIPDRRVASLAALRPKLATIDGLLAGTIAVRGPLALPGIDADLRWHGYRTANGATATTAISATGTPKQIAAKIDHAGGAVAITAEIDRRTAGRVDIDARVRADDTPLSPVLPAFVAGTKLRGADLGRLRWNMDADLALVRGALAEAAITGTLDVDGGAFAIPGSKRRYHDIDVSIVGEPGRVRIESLAVRESDIENKNRRLDVKGVLALDKLRPSKLHLDLGAKDWLVFGTPTLGLADAPRAAATFDIGVDVDLATPVLAVDATVRSLALAWPERFDRGHGPESMSVGGDIIYVDRGTRAGKLPVTARVAAAPRKRRPVDIRIHIPDPIRIEQPPIAAMARGDLTVAIRDAGVTTRGRLTMDRGNLYLFGHHHPLVDGSLEFSDAHPRGWLSLTFERHLPPVVMRQLSRASAGAGARVTFTGSPTSKPKTTLSGAANAALFEVMAMNNAGRPLHAVRPGMPATATVQAPRGDQLQMLTFMASNLPHLLFLDKITAWSGERYGRIENVEAEAYGKKSRVRAVVRPRTPGRSTAEVQLDRVLVDDDGAAVGVGVRAGNRLGGGVGVFVEWSSRD